MNDGSVDAEAVRRLAAGLGFTWDAEEAAAVAAQLNGVRDALHAVAARVGQADEPAVVFGAEP